MKQKIDFKNSRKIYEPKAGIWKVISNINKFLSRLIRKKIEERHKLPIIRNGKSNTPTDHTNIKG
jgi:hypothetical protein